MSQDKDVQIISRPNPFSVERHCKLVKAGRSISEVVDELYNESDVRMLDIMVTHNGRRVGPIEWGIKLSSKDSLTIRTIPQGGGDGKSILRTVLFIVLIVVAQQWELSSLLTIQGVSAGVINSVGSTLLMVVGSLAINAIAPPYAPTQGAALTGGGGTDDPVYSIAGQNGIRPYGSIPQVLGRHRQYPPYAAQPYTEVEGNDQYLRLLFCCGYGPLSISDIRLGETTINAFDGVEVEIKASDSDPDITLYTNDVAEQSLSILMKETDDWHTRTTGLDVDEISLDISFPRGLVEIDSVGNQIEKNVNVDFQYRKVGDINWIAQRSHVTYAAFTVDIKLSPHGGTYLTSVYLNRYSGQIGYATAYHGAAGIYPPVPQWALPLARIITKKTYGGQDDDETTFTFAISDFRASSVEFQEGIYTGFNINPPLVEPGPSDYSVALDVDLGTLSVSVLDSTEKTTQVVRKSLRVPVPNGQYEVRLRRLTADTDNLKINDLVYWSVLREFTSRNPVNEPNMALIALRIKATDQLNGVISDLNCISQTITKDWDSTTSTWVDDIATSNPASLYRHILQGAANKKALSDSAIDLPGVQAWYETCAAKGFECNYVMENRTSVNDALALVASTGRASRTTIDGKYSVVEDKLKSTIIQHFTPRNSWGFSASKVFLKLPHGFRVRFRNRDLGWIEDERIVYDDGYDVNNATLIEELSLPGSTSPEEAYMHARYHIATARLRPETYVFNTDFEYLVCTRGDLVRFSHDITLHGIGTARVKVVNDDATNVTSVILDSEFFSDTGISYNIRFRKKDGSSLAVNVVPTDLDDFSVEFTFSDTVSIASGPEVGDLAMFGEAGTESIEAIVKAIEPSGDLTARIVLVDYAPAVHSAHDTIPAFDTQITEVGEEFRNIIPAIDNIRSGEEVLLRNPDGTLVPRIVIDLAPQTKYPGLIDRLEIQYRFVDSEASWVSQTEIDKTQVIITGIESGRIYDLRLRYLIDGRYTSWAEINDYTVVGTTTPPPDVDVLLVENDNLIWSYAPPIDFAGFLVRYAAGSVSSWSAAVPAHIGVVTTNSFSIADFPGGTLVFMVKGVDTTGNESDNSATVIVGLGDPVVDNLIFTRDYQAEDYPGVLVDCTLVGSALEADDLGSLFWPVSGVSLFWPIDGDDLFWTTTYADMVYTAEYVPLVDTNPSKLTLITDLDGSSYLIEYKTTGLKTYWSGIDSSTFWSGTDSDPVWSNEDVFKAWPGFFSNPLRQTYIFRVSIAGGPVQGAINDFKILLDVPDILEVLSDVIISSGGSSLPVLSNFRAIKNIQLTLQDDGGDAVIVVVKSKYKDGPEVECFDISEATTQGLVDVTLQGY